MFGEPSFIDLRARGIDEVQAAVLHARLATFAEEWDSLEMDIYNDYDTAKAKLQNSKVLSVAAIQDEAL